MVTVPKRISGPTKGQTRRLATPKSAISSFSASDVLAAGGAEKFAITKGINPKTARISGVVRISRAETDRLQTELRNQK